MLWWPEVGGIGWRLAGTAVEIIGKQRETELLVDQGTGSART